MDEESSFREDDDNELTIESLINETTGSPGLRAAANYDVPLIRDKGEGHESLETIVSAIVNGCIFGKLCL